MAIIYVDLENGNEANDGSSWALAKKILPITGNDEIRIAKTPDPINTGIQATFERQSDTVILSSAITETIDQAIGSTWTGNSYTPVSAYSTYKKLGASMQQFYFYPQFTTGKAAYKSFVAQKDLSSYSKIMLWYSVANVADAAARSFRICLCSDSTGDVVVNSFYLPALSSINSPHPIIIDNGAPLGSNINSVAIYCDNTSTKYIQIRINHIEACGDINLRTLIGISSTVGSKWYAIQSIVGTTLKIDQGGHYNTFNLGYDDDDETSVDLYYRKGVEFIVTSNRNITGNLEYLFGWNKNTNEVDGETWLDCWTPSNYTTFLSNANTTKSIKNVGIIRGYNAVSFTYHQNIFENLSIIACLGGSVFRCSGGIADGLTILNCYYSTEAFYGNMSYVKNLRVNSNYGTSGALVIDGSYGKYINVECYNNHWIAFFLGKSITSNNAADCGAGNYIKNIVIRNTSTVPIMIAGSSNIFDNIDFYDDRNRSIYIIGENNIFKNSRNLMDYGLAHNNSAYNHLKEVSYDNVYGNNRYWFTSLSYAEWQTTIKHESGVGAWEVFMNTSHVTRFQANDDLRPSLTLLEIAVEENIAISIFCWVLGSSSNQKNKICVRPIISDIVSVETLVYIPVSTEWSLITLSFIPIKTGIAVIEYVHYDSTTYLAPIVL